MKEERRGICMAPPFEEKKICGNFSAKTKWKTGNGKEAKNQFKLMKKKDEELRK
jgi:hypothetical protein